jgi:hypothetical protein
MRTHNLNSIDAAILTMLLDYVQSLPTGSPACILVASDKRLLRASGLVGLGTLNPETLTPPSISTLLAGL